MDIVICEQADIPEDRGLQSIIYNAARDGNLDRIQLFTRGRPAEDQLQLLTAKTFKSSPILIAARNGYFEIVKFLVDAGVDYSETGTVAFDGEEIVGAAPLWAAAAAGHLQIVKYLLDCGADINQTTWSQSSALRGACFDGHIDTVRVLVERGADVNQPNRHGHTPLMIAAFRKHERVARLLIGSGADVNQRTHKGSTSLHDAVEAGSVDMCRLLLDGGALPQADDLGLSPLLVAAELASLPMVDYLLEVCDSPGAEQVDSLKLLGATLLDKYRDVAAGLAVWHRAADLILKLADAYAQPPRPPAEIYAQYSEFRSHDDVERMLLDNDAMRYQALMIRERVLGADHPDTFYYLRFRGAIYADIRKFERCFELWLHALRLQLRLDRPSALMLQATVSAFVEVFDAMLAGDGGRDALRMAPLEPPRPALLLAVVECAADELRKLVRARASGGGDEADAMPCCSMHARRGHADCVGALCRSTLHLVALFGKLSPTAEQTVDLRRHLYRLQRAGLADCVDNSLLHLACSPHSESARLPSAYVCAELLAAGARVDAPNGRGETALHVALRARFVPAIVRLLLDKGAHVDLRAAGNAPGEQTALEMLQAHPKLLRPPFRAVDHLSLQCLAANAIISRQIPYEHVLTREMVAFVQSH